MGDTQSVLSRLREELSYREYIMQTISRADIPEDFSYYRTGSKVFYEYLSQFRSYLIREVNKR